MWSACGSEEWQTNPKKSATCGEARPLHFDVEYTPKLLFRWAAQKVCSSVPLAWDELWEESHVGVFCSLQKNYLGGLRPSFSGTAVGDPPTTGEKGSRFLRLMETWASSEFLMPVVRR